MLAAICMIACLPLSTQGRAVAAQELPELPVLEPDAEVLHYRWRTRGLLSFIFPRSGTATVTTEEARDGRLRSQIRVETDGEAFWLSGSELDAETLTLRETWSSYRWRGRTKTKRKMVQEEGVVDMVAAILTLRERRPDKKLPLRFLAGSKVYPIQAVPDLEESDQVIRYFLEGMGRRRRERWDDEAEVFVSQQESLPQHISLIGTMIRIDLELDRDALAQVD